MATTVTMPQLGETVIEGTILSWAKQPGEAISEDEVLLEISTDKVDTEVPSPVAGIVHEILVAEGETVPVGTPLAVIGEPGEEIAARPQAEAAPAQPVERVVSVKLEPAAEPDPAPQPDPVPEPVIVAAAAAAPVSAPAGVQSGPGNGMRQVLSPVVRRLAAASGVDLATVPGTGAGGRITRKDLEAFIASGAPIAQAPAAPAVAAAPAPGGVAPPAPTGPIIPEGGTAAPPEGVALLSGDHVVELDRLRVRIADNMLRAKQSAAHVWASIEVDYENVERVRQAHREEWKKMEGFSLTYLPFIARATVDALAAFPVVNSSIYPEQGKAVFHTSINLGIAVDLDQKGLLVATVRGADGLRVVGLARAIRSVAEKARDKALQPDDVTGSTFSITNPGPFGSFLTAPIINVPNTAILSTDTVSKRPVVVTDAYGNDSISIRHIGYLGFSWDHRAFDGSTAVLFLQRLKQSLETWDWEQELA
jgi:2-oxoglutarate dehydrogenase E2 component (dihydrolipoamide succinyltransferase)